jgi:protein gp37
MEDRKRAATIFVGSAMDLGAKEIPEQWFKQIMDSGRRMVGQGKTLIYLTKRPEAFINEELLDHMWLGATVNHRNQTDRLREVGGKLLTVGGAQNERNCFISFEPLLENISCLIPSRVSKNVRGFIIGGQTKPDILPDPAWVMELIDLANELGICVFLKDNLKGLEGIDIMAYRDLAWDTNK